MRYGVWGLLLLVSAVSQAELLFEHAYVRGLLPGQSNTAAFMRIRNTSDHSVEVVAASSPSAKKAEIHAHHHNNGMMRMEQVEKITVPAKGEFALRPGEHHLMLIDLLHPLKEGSTITLTLSLADGSTYSSTLPVRSVLNEHKHH